MTSDRKSIKVTVEQRQRLFGMKRPGEDFSDVLGRLLNLYDLVGRAEPLIHGAAIMIQDQRDREAVK